MTEPSFRGTSFARASCGGSSIVVDAMITRRSVCISLASVVGASSVQAEDGPAPTRTTGDAQSQPSFEELTRRPAVYQLRGMPVARVREGLPYKRVAGTALSFDLYTSPAARRPRPAVILVHGSAPAIGARRWGVFRSYGQFLAAAGMVGIAFDHRLLGPDRLPDAQSDSADLITYVREHAGSLGIDPGRLAVWAFSAGGPLLAPLIRQRPNWGKLLVGYYVIMEPLGTNGGSDSSVEALGVDASTAPPIQIARAGLDNPAINATIDRFLARAITGGATVDLLTHPTGHHGFDVLDPTERSRQIIRRTFEALRENLGVDDGQKRS